MRLLILGGTIFLGRQLVEAALARGHDVTLFNRGQHNAELFPNVEKLRGDRNGDLDALRGRRWDAVIDTAAYVPRVVRKSAELLAGVVDHYTFISTISVYANFSQRKTDENAPVGTIEDEATEEVTGETYGPLKALCEQAAESALPGRVLTIRPGLIVGPNDPTDRFTYWVRRVAHGGEVLAPGRPERPVEFIDVRDLAEWNVRMVEAEQTGVYNATGPGQRLPMGQLLEECRSASHSDATVTWLAERFLLERGVDPWSEMPLWIPEEGGEAGLFSIDCRKAIAAGLRFRPVGDTVADTLAWDRTRPDDIELRAGMKREREAELLQEWHRRG